MDGVPTMRRTPSIPRAALLGCASALLACYASPTASDDGDDDGSASADDDDDGGPATLDDGADDAPTSADDGAGDDGSSGGDDANDSGDPSAPTFAEDVAPILAANCWSCHVAGGIAPFPMQDYDEVSALAPAIVAAVESRAMPPWPLDASGECGEIVDARVLEDDEIATISAWVDAGKQPGDLAQVPPPNEPPALDDVSASIAIEPYMPQGNPPENPTDDYRCFVVAPPTASDTVLTGFEVHPGVQSMVHHIVVFGLESDEAVATAVGMSGQDGRPGYTCFGGAGVGDSSLLVGWAPGVPVGEYPEGTGVPVSGGRPLVVQMHYNLAAGIELDETAVDLRFDDSAIPLRSLTIIDTDLAIPPNTTDHVEGASTSFGGGDTTIVAVFPHMHQIGKELRVDVDTGACAIGVPRWDFHWQQLYSYAEPVVIPGGSQLTLSCRYDSTGRDETTYFGEGSSEEMCGIQFLALP
jgi:hypothetical protein